MQNVKDVKKVGKFKKKVYSFDKKGNKIEKTIETDDMYRVVLNNYDSIYLTKEQFNLYHVKFDENSDKKEEIPQNIDEVLEQLEEENENVDNFGNVSDKTKELNTNFLIPNKSSDIIAN